MGLVREVSRYFDAGVLAYCDCIVVLGGSSGAHVRVGRPCDVGLAASARPRCGGVGGSAELRSNFGGSRQSWSAWGRIRSWIGGAGTCLPFEVLGKRLAIHWDRER